MVCGVGRCGLTRTAETGETRVRTDYLNFDVSLCIQIKKKISIRRHWDCIFVEF